MVVDSIKNGLVIDHIKAGNAMKLLHYLGVDTEQGTETVAIIMNATSQKAGRKDIVKIEDRTDIDMDVVGLIAPEATVNVIKDNVLVEKIRPELPKSVINVLSCRNPRCVTSTERDIPQIFILNDEVNMEYRCRYCDEIIAMRDVKVL
ncbi:MAG: aspartate carbamoyltransferase regulatory subunit [Clostridia bacterium]|nr:aspartate carbamoyltransferase regulatory subunit [Clostridia bacterium]